MILQEGTVLFTSEASKLVSDALTRAKDNKDRIVWEHKGLEKRWKYPFWSNEKRAPNSCLGDLLGMKCYPVIWGL